MDGSDQNVLLYLRACVTELSPTAVEVHRGGSGGSGGSTARPLPRPPYHFVIELRHHGLLGHGAGVGLEQLQQVVQSHLDTHEAGESTQLPAPRKTSLAK